MWYVPGHVSCLLLDEATQDELAEMGRGRALLIDYFACAGRFGWRFGDVVFRWLDDLVGLPDRALLVDDLEEPPTFIRADLAPLLVLERARLRIVGPRRLPFLRHPIIELSDGGLWLEFFAARATPLGWGR